VSLATARLLSRRFYDIVTPLKYETLRLNEEIIAPDAYTRFPQAFEKICAHTRHVEVDDELDATGVKRLLEKLQRLSSVR
jgi:hypothetical protein